MLRFKFIQLAAIAGATLVPHIAAAEKNDAVLRQLQGSVLLNHATGYSSAAANMPLRAGDRVLTMGNSRATVVWTDGCSAQLEENSIFTFQKRSPCQGGADTRKKVGAYFARALGSDIITDVPVQESAPAGAAEPIPSPLQETPAPVNQAIVPVETEVVASGAGMAAGGVMSSQTIITGVAIGAGLAVVASAGSQGGGGGKGAVSPE